MVGAGYLHDRLIKPATVVAQAAQARSLPRPAEDTAEDAETSEADTTPERYARTGRQGGVTIATPVAGPIQL